MTTSAILIGVLLLFGSYALALGDLIAKYRDTRKLAQEDRATRARTHAIRSNARR